MSQEDTIDAAKLRVCLISTSQILSNLMLGRECEFLGGAEVQQTLIVQILRDIGCEVSVLVHDFGQPDEVVTEDGVRLIKAYRTRRQLIDLLFFWRNPLWKAMKRADADVYYQRATGTITGIICILCKLQGKPFVHATSIDLDLDGTKEAGLNPVKRVIYRYGLRNATAVVVQTEQQNADLRRRFGREGFIIRNTFALPSESSDRDRRFVIWVGSFRDHKRPEWFVDVARSLPDQDFLMIGGPFYRHPELYEEISRQADDIPNLKLTGIVPFNEVGEYFRKARLLVCTSTMEGFPNTFLQAWSLGVPVVSTFDPDGTIEKHGIGRHCTDLRGIINAVRDLLSDDTAYEETSRRAVEYVKENHSQEVVSARYRELLDGVARR